MRMVRRCIRLTRLTLICEVIRYRLVRVRQNLKKRLRVSGPQSPFSISSSFIFFFVLLAFFLITKIQAKLLIICMAASATAWKPLIIHQHIVARGSYCTVLPMVCKDKFMEARKALDHRTAVKKEKWTTGHPPRKSSLFGSCVETYQNF